MMRKDQSDEKLLEESREFLRKSALKELDKEIQKLARDAGVKAHVIRERLKKSLRKKN
jgi:hypothetical protein